jgi:hypothetical protein
VLVLDDPHRRMLGELLGVVRRTPAFQVHDILNDAHMQFLHPTPQARFDTLPNRRLEHPISHGLLIANRQRLVILSIFDKVQCL